MLFFTVLLMLTFVLITNVVNIATLKLNEADTNKRNKQMLPRCICYMLLLFLNGIVLHMQLTNFEFPLLSSCTVVVATGFEAISTYDLYKKLKKLKVA